jgi:hypothetical protein
MPKRIFCKSATGPFDTREHILPESLGGGEWAILPDGLLCNQCQNRFGSSIEQQALGDYPFTHLRILLSIPTKKGKAPWFKFNEGIVKASLQPRSFHYEPSAPFKRAMDEGGKTEIRLLAHPMKPHMICRFLLKMALEVVASDNSEAVFDKKYDKARNFALLDEKLGDWWYLQRENVSAVNNYIKTRNRPSEWAEPVKLEVVTFKDGAEIFHLKLLYLELFIPLEPHIQSPPKNSLQEPEYRLFFA